jgi:hypothetical protein
MEWSPRRDRHNLKPSICEPANVVVGRVRRDAGQAVVEPIPPTHRRIDDRTVRRPPAQIRRSRKVVVPLLHGEPPHHAPDRPPSPYVWLVTICVIRQRVRRTGRDLLHGSRCPLLHRGCGRRNILVRVSIPNTSVDRSPTSEGQ